jgi:BlaI family transcriptional regulator, penicillinase repressor
MHSSLSRRERQIMETLYRKKTASVLEVLREIPDPPSYSAVRATVNILERKGFLKHSKVGKKYVYSPKIPQRKAMRGAVNLLLRTYFEDSLEKAVTAMLEIHKDDLSVADFERLAEIIKNAKKQTPA